MSDLQVEAIQRLKDCDSDINSFLFARLKELAGDKDININRVDGTWFVELANNQGFISEGDTANAAVLNYLQETAPGDEGTTEDETEKTSGGKPNTGIRPKKGKATA
jgi:hypothetical protein